MNENKDQKQNRRDFLVSSARNAVIGGLGFIGISLGYKSVTSNAAQSCEVNLPCRNCFKLGSCSEDQAVEQREEIRLKDQSAEKQNGTGNG
jgi:hypothetical protein